ncbi:MAG: ATP-binding cassette domain-containing protein [Pseudomonadota bacterium]
MLEARELTVQRGGKAILDQVSLSVARGEILALIGPNGAGKSTLLNCFSGAIAPDAGKVLVDGAAPIFLDPAQLALRRAVLDQNPSSSAPFRVEEIIRLGLPIEIDPETAERLVADAIDLMDLGGFATRRIDQLSGGEAHRTHAARTLVQLWAGRHLGHGGWLLLDEPTASLDMGHQDSILKAARHARDQGAGVVVIFHDLTLAAAISDRVALLDNGSLAAIGKPGDVLTAECLSPVYGIELVVFEPRPGYLVVTPIFPSVAKETDHVCGDEPLSRRERPGGGLRGSLEKPRDTAGGDGGL